MISRVRSSLGAGLLVILGMTACSHGQQKQAAAPPPKPTQAELSGQSLQLAAQEQKALGEQAKRVDASHAATVAAEQQLAHAQAQEQQERTKAQQLEQQVNQHLNEGVQHAQQAQAGVESLGAGPTQPLQTAAGRIMAAAPSRVVLQAQGGKTMTFTVDGRTRVLIGSEAHSVTEIQQGADAQVAYAPKGAQMTALVIRVLPAGNQGAETRPPTTGVPPPSASPPSGNGSQAPTQ